MTAQLHKKYAIQQPEVHNLHYRHRRTELWPQLTCKFLFEVYIETEREADHNTMCLWQKQLTEVCNEVSRRIHDS